METLPVELIHRIFDHLDAETILLSLRSVCRAFRSIVQTYDRYNINLHLISKWKFSLFCRLIQPENAISLTLSNDQRTSDQIQRFFSIFSLQQFHRLRSLTLLQMDLIQLETILKSCQLQFLRSFSCEIRHVYERYKKISIDSLSTFVSQTSLRQLHLALDTHLILAISWPIHSTIQSLSIQSSVSINKLCEVFQCSPHLNTLSLNGLSMMNSSENFHFPQLKSLTIDNLHVSIEELERLLLMTPSLIFLRLIGGGTNLTDGKRWEDFLDKNLPHLSKFEFDFISLDSEQHTPEDIQSIIDSFSTPFWIEQKSWFITYEYHESFSGLIYLSSLPICKSSFDYEPQSEKISLSTYPAMMNNDRRIINNTHSLKLTLTASMAEDILEKNITRKEILFPNVTDLQLEFWRDWPLVSLDSLDVFIDISRTVRMTLNVFPVRKWKKAFWTDMNSFLEQAHHLSSLVVNYPTVNQFYSNLPRSIQHLEVCITDLNQIPIILQRCSRLSTIKFSHVNYSLTEKIVQWFTNHTIDSTCHQGDDQVSVWLGKINFNSENSTVSHQYLTTAFSKIKAKKDKIWNFISRN